VGSGEAVEVLGHLADPVADQYQPRDPEAIPEPVHDGEQHLGVPCIALEDGNRDRAALRA